MLTKTDVDDDDNDDDDDDLIYSKQQNYIISSNRVCNLHSPNSLFCCQHRLFTLLFSLFLCVHTLLPNCWYKLFTDSFQTFNLFLLSTSKQWFILLQWKREREGESTVRYTIRCVIYVGWFAKAALCSEFWSIILLHIENFIFDMISTPYNWVSACWVLHILQCKLHKM